MGVLTENRRARFDYDVLETLEAGVALLGNEVKSVQAGRADITAAFVTIHRGELFLTNATIPPWQARNTPGDYDERRPRKLLLHKNEIASLIGTLKTRGLTAVPLKLYTRGRRIKAEIGIVRYRKKADKREVIKRREAEREIRRALKSK